MLQMARIWSLLSLLLPVVSGRCAWALLVSVSLAPVSSCGNARGGHGGAGWWQPPRFFSVGFFVFLSLWAVFRWFRFGLCRDLSPPRLHLPLNKVLRLLDERVWWVGLCSCSCVVVGLSDGSFYCSCFRRVSHLSVRYLYMGFWFNGCKRSRRAGMEAAISGTVRRTTASSIDGSLSCRRRFSCRGIEFVCVWILHSGPVMAEWPEAVGAVASRFEGTFLSVARGARPLSRLVSVCKVRA